jgi:PAS domain S-box-containing protein
LYDFLRQAPIACHEIDLSGEVVFVNEAECELLGLSADGILGRPILEFVAPEEQEASRAAVRRKLSGEQFLSSFERDYVRPDGVRLVLEIHERHIRDAASRIVGMRSFLVDITQRKRTERALLESEKLYRHLVENASDIIYQTDVRGRFTIFNSVATRLLGYSSEELAGKHYLDLIRPDFRPAVRKFYRRQLVRGLSHTYLELPVLARDGSEIWFGQNVEIIQDGGRVAGFQAITRDITVRRRSEEVLQSAREELERRVAERTAELQQANERLRREILERQREEKARLDLEAQIQHTQRLESLGVLAGGIAHDFNNLLAVILGRAGLALADLPHDSSARANLDEVICAATAAASLTQQMLAYSGRGRFTVDLLNLTQLIEEVTRLVAAVISKMECLSLHLSPDLPPIEGDPAQLRQVVINLLTNASDALGEGCGEIHVTTGLDHIREDEFASQLPDALLAPGPYVFLEVSDTGCGMDRATLNKIFDPFFTTKFTGRGLGLAAVHGIVRGHRGALRVESEPGRGASFRILLPAAVGKTAAPPAPPEAVEESDWKPEGAVLVVDDEPAVRALACQILERSGVPVLTAVDGYDAVRQFQAHRDEIAAVLLDLTMPGLDGGEVFRRLIEAKPGIQVILCSGYDVGDVNLKLGAERPAGFLRKPYSPADLMRSFRSSSTRAATH